MLMQNLGGQTKIIMVFSEVAYVSIKSFKNVTVTPYKRH